MSDIRAKDCLGRYPSYVLHIENSDHDSYQSSKAHVRAYSFAHFTKAFHARSSRIGMVIVEAVGPDLGYGWQLNEPGWKSARMKPHYAELRWQYQHSKGFKSHSRDHVSLSLLERSAISLSIEGINALMTTGSPFTWNGTTSGAPSSLGIIQGEEVTRVALKMQVYCGQQDCQILDHETLASRTNKLAHKMLVASLEIKGLEADEKKAAEHVELYKNEPDNASAATVELEKRKQKVKDAKLAETRALNKAWEQQMDLIPREDGTMADEKFNDQTLKIVREIIPS
ncbi:uncharacterized protein PAC_09641 [Phialocephala subalpina]|uniref:Uncharacterized protein n=1 Tax=Phialocephala subalpina TaxID=576137 RepID=A0A1L7X421_9HELO|nr:uncharacterized protein PAC_09641 [Phialocephala subalpina]